MRAEIGVAAQSSYCLKTQVNQSFVHLVRFCVHLLPYADSVGRDWLKMAGLSTDCGLSYQPLGLQSL